MMALVTLPDLLAAIILTSIVDPPAPPSVVDELDSTRGCIVCDLIGVIVAEIVDNRYIASFICPETHQLFS